MSLKPPVSKSDHQSNATSGLATLVEYGDYQCPHCGIAHPFVKKLMAKFQGKLNFVFRNFPLEELHPEAMISAQFAEAADKQGKFWEMHDMIFENQSKLSEQYLFREAEMLHLKIDQLREDVNSEAVRSKIENDFENGVMSGVNGTPSFFLNGKKIDSYDETYRSLEVVVQSVI